MFILTVYFYKKHHFFFIFYKKQGLVLWSLLNIFVNQSSCDCYFVVGVSNALVVNIPFVFMQKSASILTIYYL